MRRKQVLSLAMLVGGVVVVLTATGREVWDTLVSRHARDESGVVGVLGRKEIRQLNDTLRTLLTGFDDEPN